MLVEDLFKAPYHEKLGSIINNMVAGAITDEEMLFQEVVAWEGGARRKLMLDGERYYLNKGDIKDKKQEIMWKSNQRLQHGFAKKLVDQKIGYLLSKAPTVSTDKEAYSELLEDVFDRGLLKKLKNVGKEAINKGIAYLYPYINDSGELSFKKFPSEQIIPFWADNEHLEITSFLRVYEVDHFLNGKKTLQKKVEHYHSKGIRYFVLDGGKLVPDNMAGFETNYHILIGDQPYTWERIPLIHFKYNEEEQPLLESIKSLVDNYNLQTSTNSDILADIPKFIYKLINYGGEDLKEFLDDLNTYRAVKLEENGGLDKLQADIQTEAVEKEAKRIRDAIYEFGRGVDTTDKELGTASGVALRYRYSDLDMDSNILEAEFHSSIEHMLWFVSRYFLLTGQGDFTEERVNFIFNRDIIINESEVIKDCQNSAGVLDQQTIRENHPWYTKEVEERLQLEEAELQKQRDEYLNAFPPTPPEPNNPAAPAVNADE